VRDAPPREVGPERISRRGASDQPALPANCVRNVACVAHAIVIGPFELAAPGPGSSKAPKTRARSLDCDFVVGAGTHLLPNLLPIRLVLVACDRAENALFGSLGLERARRHRRSASGRASSSAKLLNVG
jgi:hypothetical protein